MFTGEYRHAVDGKGRLAVPARFRGQLADGAVVARWIDSCLAIFPMTAWTSSRTASAACRSRTPTPGCCSGELLAGAIETESLDAQGRVLVPQGLRAYASIEGEALVLGSRDHAEVWAPARWEAYSRSLDDPDAFAQAIAGLGI